MDYGFGCDSAAQACLIAIRLSGKTQIDWSALRNRSFSSFNSTKRASLDRMDRVSLGAFYQVLDRDLTSNYRILEKRRRN
jgi:hypothetical protein